MDLSEEPKRWGVVMTDVTRILNAIERGDAKATDELLPLVYEELRLLAAQKLSHEPPGQTLQATALVHEVYLRLVGEERQSWDSRGHFFAAAAEAMRRILVENARHKKTQRMGGGCRRVELVASQAVAEDDLACDDLLILDQALEKLSQKDETKGNIVKLRYFAGLTIEQTACSLGISPATAKRSWTYARAWLIREMGGPTEQRSC
jgi:RNA polymerase sigma factor (TIGR02999 family)